MDDEKMMGPNDIKITKSVKLVDTKITGYTVLHDKRIAYIKEDSTIEEYTKHLLEYDYVGLI